jgi:hypothetical protein
MWVPVSPERFLELQPMLEFPNPEAEKQKKLVQAGIVRWAGHVEPMVKLWSYGYGHERLVPMGAGLSGGVVGVETADRYRKRTADTEWLMDHQKRSVYALAKHYSGVVVAPCGGGKTQIGIGLHEVLGECKPTLVVVHTQDLATQWAGRLKQCVPTGNVFYGFGVDRFRAALGWALELPHSLLVATVQTLAEMGPDLRTARFSTIIVDEAHHTPAKTFRSVLEHVTADGDAQPRRRMDAGHVRLARSDSVRGHGRLPLSHRADGVAEGHGGPHAVLLGLWRLQRHR